MTDIIRDVEVYPLEAYEFVQRGLDHTVRKLGRSRGDASADDDVVAHRPADAHRPDDADLPRSQHVTGQELSLGLRAYAWERWGLLARTVLRRWNITSTMDFGKIVYAMIEGGVLAKSPTDKLDDFRNVYDFATLERDYRPDVSALSTERRSR